MRWRTVYGDEWPVRQEKLGLDACNNPGAGRRCVRGIVSGGYDVNRDPEKVWILHSWHGRVNE